MAELRHRASSGYTQRAPAHRPACPVLGHAASTASGQLPGLPRTQSPPTKRARHAASALVYDQACLRFLKSPTLPSSIMFARQQAWAACYRIAWSYSERRRAGLTTNKRRIEMAGELNRMGAAVAERDWKVRLPIFARASRLRLLGIRPRVTNSGAPIQSSRMS